MEEKIETIYMTAEEAGRGTMVVAAKLAVWVALGQAAGALDQLASVSEDGNRQWLENRAFELRADATMYWPVEKTRIYVPIVPTAEDEACPR